MKAYLYRSWAISVINIFSLGSLGRLPDQNYRSPGFGYIYLPILSFSWFLLILKGKLFIWLKDGRNKLSIVKVRGSVDYSYWKSCMKKLNEETEKTTKEEARPKEQSQRSEVFLSFQTFKYSRCSQFKIKVLFKDNGPNSFLHSLWFSWKFLHELQLQY